MIDLFGYFKSLVSRAMLERAPRVNVSGRVLYALRYQEQSYDAPLARLAALALAPAAVMVIVSANLFLSISDPLESLFYAAVSLLP